MREGFCGIVAATAIAWQLVSAPRFPSNFFLPALLHSPRFAKESRIWRHPPAGEGRVPRMLEWNRPDAFVKAVPLHAAHRLRIQPYDTPEPLKLRAHVGTRESNQFP